MQELTSRQAQILDFIQRFMRETGRPPTRAEIARELGFRSANAAEDHLRALKRKGVIDLIPGASRGIRLLDEDREGGEAEAAAGLPLIGRVAAGQPMLATEHIEARYQLDPGLFNPRPHYLLRVHGMSMRDAGILDGDLVAVCHLPDVRNGQIVVARLDEEVTVKRYRQSGSTVFLVPHNPDYETIQVDLRVQHLVIEGVVVGVIRNGISVAG
jgi:repressor LexA